jgi:uncharacterized protein YjbI with pentapeptide repeats
MTDATLIFADLTDAKMTGANLTGADLTGANLHFAVLRDSNLTRSMLFYAKLTLTDLTRADLTGAFLHYANLEGANLQGAKGILSFAPNEFHKDNVYAFRWPDGIRMKAGDFWGTLPEFEAAVAAKEASNPHRAYYETVVIPALHAWHASE